MNIDKYYEFISAFYADKKAKRSGVPYIKHIDEGLEILDRIGASNVAKAAYCVHPVFQVPKDLKQIYGLLDSMSFDPRVLVLAMEYRNKANAYPCRPRTDNYELGDLPVMVLPEVKDMLIADKVQNYKDFLKHHKGTHARSEQLDKYFKLWLEHLGADYNSLVIGLE